MGLKVIMSFSQDKEGWSEVHYTNDENIASFSGPPDGEFATGTAANSLMNFRLACLVKSAFLDHIRVSDLNIPGAFTTYDVPIRVGKGRYAGEKADSTEIFSSLLVTLSAGFSHRRRIYMGGIPEEVVTAPQSYTPTPTFKVVLSNFLAAMRVGRYQVRSRPRVNLLTDQPIITFVVQPDGRTALMTPLVRPVTMPTAWYVLIRGLKAPAGWNGVHKASLGPTEGTVLLGPARRVLPSLPAFALTSTARVVLMTPEFNSITITEVNKIVSRRRGRPFGVSRGRR